MTSRFRSLMLAAAVVAGLAHLVHLPRTLEDIDSINFALGVESFDVPNHRPHPPGYPVFIALAKISTAAIRALRPGWDRDRQAATGLAVWGALAAGLSVIVITRFWIEAELGREAALLAALVTVTSPLFWLTSSRPLSDVPGLAVTVLVQAWLLLGLNQIRARAATVPRAWIVAVAAAGFIVGVRSQSMWLTGPFVVWGLGMLAIRGRVRDVTLTVGAGAAGVLTWLVPLLVMTGVGPYFSVLSSQRADDFAGPHMLAVSLTWRRFATYMGHTFVNPWQVRTLAHIVLALALIGAAVAFWRRRRLLSTIAVGFLPYLAFHLAFQETVTTRYALPLVVPVAGMAVVALGAAGTRFATLGALVIVVASLVLGEPRLSAYASEGAPAFRAFQAMQRALPSMPEPPIVKMHHQVWWAVRRIADWYRPVWDVGPQPFPGDREFLGVVDHFRSGDTRPVWFLAHLPRTDMAAFDRRAAEQSGTYELAPELSILIGGTRVETFAWWTIRQPGWMLGRGWALTPELAGMTEQDRASGKSGPAEAFIRRQPGPVRLMIAGRYLGSESDPPGRISVFLDGRPIGDWLVSASDRPFLRWFELASGTAQGEGAYATLEVRVASDRSGGAAPRVGLEQFDAAGSQESIYALTTGWHEQEQNPDTGLSWRWTSARSSIEVRGPERDRTLTIAGESPLRYFSEAPTVVVRAGDQLLGSYTFGADFSQDVRLPAAVLRNSSGLITIETSKTFKPADRGASADRRDLGLRVYSVSVR